MVISIARIAFIREEQTTFESHKKCKNKYICGDEMLSQKLSTFHLVLQFPRYHHLKA